MSRSTVLWNVGVALAYIAACEAVAAWLRLSHIPPIIWYASGVGLAAMLLRGLSVVPGLMAAAFICALLAQSSPELALLLTLATAAQIGLAWWLLSRVVKIDVALGHVRDVLALIVVGCTVVPLFNAAVTLLTQHWRGETVQPGELLRTQVTAMGEFVGILLIVPVILSVAAAWRTRRAWSRHLESLVLQSANAAVALVVFGGMMAPSMSAESLPYAIFPFTYWAAFRLGMRDTALALLVASTVAVGCHSLGVGPFVMPNMSSSNAFAHYASLYLFLIVLSATSLLAAATQQQREAAEAGVRESEQRYRTLIERMNEGVNITDADAKMTFVSDRFCTMVGYAREELLGETGAMLTLPEQHVLWEESHRKRRAGVSESHSLSMRRKDGKILHVWISTRPQFGPDGAYAGSLNVVLDITDRRLAEDRARGHLDQLAHVARVASMGEMASAIAHEVNQPLTAIANYASASLRLMQADKMSREESIAVMQQLADEAERAGEVVRKMRGFVRGEQGHPVRIPVAELFADVLRLCGPEARVHHVTLDAEAGADALAVTADVIQLQQVLLNLVRNAIEAIAAADTRERSVKLTAMVADKGMVEIQVTDSGPGIAAADLDLVFTPFHTTKPDGVGIGLALSRSIVEAYGGRVWASPVSTGAVFHLTIPGGSDATFAERA